MSSPASAESSAGSSHARQRLLLGNLRCDVVSTDRRYAPMLAAAFGTTLLPETRSPAPSPPDVCIVIGDDVRTAPRHRGDRLIVSRHADHVVLVSDPMTWEIRAHGDACRISVAVHDPALAEDKLAYHFWILLNRAILFLGRLTLHAGAVAHRGSVSLFAGPKGAGKSTVAVRLAAAGGTLLADDHVLARRAGDRLAASGCSARVRVTAKTEAHFLPDLLGPATIDVSGVEKKEFSADRFWSACPHEERVVDRLFLLRPGSGFAFRPLRRQAALLRLIEDTGAMLRFHERADYEDFLAVLADLVGLVPCHELELGPRLADLDRLVELLEPPA